jgi:diaminopimelate epimerase
LNNGSQLISSVNTGVPHVVIVVDDIEDASVVELGREIRHHETFAPAGTNVNFVCYLKDNIIAMRTYERGVEDETLACGTGAVASAVVMAGKSKLESPISILTRSGESLKIYFSEKKGVYSDIFLEGDARIIYTAQLWEDAWK